MEDRASFKRIPSLKMWMWKGVLWIVLVLQEINGSASPSSAVPSGVANAISAMLASASASSRSSTLPQPTPTGDNPLGDKVKSMIEQTATPTAGVAEDEEEEVVTVYTTSTVACANTAPASTPTAIALANMEEVKREQQKAQIVQEIQEIRSVVNQVVQSRIEQATQQTTIQRQTSFKSYAQELFRKYERNELHMRDIQESQQIVRQALQTILTSETFKQLRVEHRSEAFQWFEKNTILNEIVRKQMEEHRFEEKIMKTWSSLERSSKEVWSKVMESINRMERNEKMQKVQEEMKQQFSKQLKQQQQEQMQQQVQQQQTQQTVVQTNTTSWSNHHQDCMQAIISSLSSTEKGSSCKALKIQHNQHYEVKDVIQSLLVPQDKIEGQLEYEIAVQNVFNRMYQDVCFREHYAEYQKELAAWYHDEGWVRRPPPIPPSKMCPPAKLIKFSRQSPPWLNRMPAYIRARYYGDSSMYEGQVHFTDGNSTDAKLFKLRRRGLLSAAEYAYLKSLKRSNDRLLLTGINGPNAGAVLPKLVKMLSTWNPPQAVRKPVQPTRPLNVLLPRSGLAALVL